MNLDFVLAKSKHLAWRVRLMSFLRGEETLTLDQVISHEHCDLGKWIYGEALEKYKDEPKIFELEQVHKKLHKHIRNVVELKHAGKEEEANAEYDKMTKVSQAIINLLDELEKALKV
ncbi:MAG: CZB domain-containing protein [Raineya sp.]|nr:CZB domain-containing protein [Raineya sp.]